MRRRGLRGMMRYRGADRPTCFRHPRHVLEGAHGDVGALTSVEALAVSTAAPTETFSAPPTTPPTAPK